MYVSNFEERRQRYESINLTVEKAQEIRAGKGHYHWICRDWANFTSKAYSSYAAAGAAADAHVAKYPAHADKVSVFYCEKSSCQ